MAIRRIRNELKAAGRSVQSIIKERDAALWAYAAILAHIKKVHGEDEMQLVRDTYEKKPSKKHDKAE